MEVWSFFSGSMGLDLGLEKSGLEVTLAVEVDKWCCATIRQNKPDLDLIEGDIQNLTATELRSHRNFNGEVFLIAGGPPCQSFSTGGKRAGLSDPRGNLIYEFFRLVREVQPTFFLFENVANLLTAALQHRQIKDRPGKHWSLKKYEEEQTFIDEMNTPLTLDELSGSAFQQLLSDIRSLGYAINFGVLDAADYGTPQHRLRLVIMGAKRGSAPILPVVTHGNKLGALPFNSVHNAIYDLLPNPGPHSIYTPNMAAFFSYIPPGGNWRDLPISLQKEALGGAYLSGGGKTGFFRRLSWDNPAPTITGRANRKASAICHPQELRPLSVKECARIQGFPDSWHFVGSMNQQYLQIGNAVPIQLGAAIGRSIVEKKLMTYPASENDLEAMRVQAIGRLRASARNKQTKKNMQPSLFEDEVVS